LPPEAPTTQQRSAKIRAAQGGQCQTPAGMAKEILHHHEIARNSRELSARKEDFRGKKN